MKPIEPGCRAIVISDNENPDNVGKEVIVQLKVNHGDTIRFGFILDGRAKLATGTSFGEAWIVSGDVKSFVDASGEQTEDGSPIHFKGLAESFLSSEGTIFNACFVTRQLMRIDGFSDEDQKKDREQEIGRGLLTPVVWAGDQYSNVE